MNFKKVKIQNDLGFGSNYNKSRFINQDGSINVERRGLKWSERFSPYHYLISIPWRKFNLIVVCSYFIINLLFAFTYMTIGIEHIDGAGHEQYSTFWDAFFFSAQTIATVGYGRMSPVGFAANSIAAFESMLGLLGFALATGLLYGRFSRANVKLLFAQKAVVAPYRGITGLMFRFANERDNHLIEAEVDVNVSYYENENGQRQRKFVALDLERKKISLFSSTWTIVHPIDDTSPFLGYNVQMMEEADVEVLVIFKAYDELFSQFVYSRFSYKYHEIVWNAKYSTVLGVNENGGTYIMIDKVGEIEAIMS